MMTSLFICVLMNIPMAKGTECMLLKCTTDETAVGSGRPKHLAADSVVSVPDPNQPQYGSHLVSHS